MIIDPIFAQQAQQNYQQQGQGNSLFGQGSYQLPETQGNWFGSAMNNPDLWKTVGLYGQLANKRQDQPLQLAPFRGFQSQQMQPGALQVAINRKKIANPY